jgi:hypothetical protein
VPHIQGIIRVGRKPDRVGAALPTLGHLRSYLMLTLLRDQTVRLALVLALGGSKQCAQRVKHARSARRDFRHAIAFRDLAFA